MKLTNKAKAHMKPGMTLIELTVVIIVLLTLISVLFFAGSAYIESSNRTACLTNQANIQKGIRGYQNIKNQTTTDTLDVATIQTAEFLSGSGGTLSIVCPTDDIPYDIGSTFSETGVKMVSCADAVYGDATIGDADSDALLPPPLPDADVVETHQPDEFSAW